MENAVPHTLGFIFLHYGLMIHRPSSLKLEILSTHVDIGLCVLRDILLLSDLFFQSSSRSIVRGRMLLMSSQFLVHCKDHKTIWT